MGISGTISVSNGGTGLTVVSEKAEPKMNLRIQISLILMLLAQWLLLLTGDYFRSTKRVILAKIGYEAAILISVLMLLGIVFNWL
jgi:hypothetical protein